MGRGRFKLTSASFHKSLVQRNIVVSLMSGGKKGIFLLFDIKDKIFITNVFQSHSFL